MLLNRNRTTSTGERKKERKTTTFERVLIIGLFTILLLPLSLLFRRRFARHTYSHSADRRSELRLCYLAVVAQIFPVFLFHRNHHHSVFGAQCCESERVQLRTAIFFLLKYMCCAVPGTLVRGWVGEMRDIAYRH